MTVLILGLILWVLAHMFKRVAPAGRAAMDAKLGTGPARGAVALALVASVLMMIIGYQMADYVDVWYPPAWTRHLNNTLMLIAVALFGMSHSKGTAKAWLRHPMLWGTAVWAMAHLLVNGDLASVILFGGIGIWALAQMAFINKSEGAWVRPETGSAKRNLLLIPITLVAFGIIAGIHMALGYNPFPG